MGTWPWDPKMPRRDGRVLSCDVVLSEGEATLCGSVCRVQDYAVSGQAVTVRGQTYLPAMVGFAAPSFPHA